MQALVRGREKVKATNLRAWLRHGQDSLGDLSSTREIGNTLSKHNRLSQFNVLRQIEHLKTYPIIQERLKKKKLTLHAWWFELSQADVYAYEESKDKFVLFDEEESNRILARMTEPLPPITG